MKWNYKNKELDKKNIKNNIGFLYKITFPDDCYYIGYKLFYSKRNIKISKKRANELYSGKGRKKKKELKIQYSDWETYNSSSKIVQQKILETKEENVIFEILELVENKQELLLKEAWMIADAFLKRDKNILNQWLSVKSFKL